MSLFPVMMLKLNKPNFRSQFVSSVPGKVGRFILSPTICVFGLQEEMCCFEKHIFRGRRVTCDISIVEAQGRTVCGVSPAAIGWVFSRSQVKTSSAF